MPYSLSQIHRTGRYGSVAPTVVALLLLAHSMRSMLLLVALMSRRILQRVPSGEGWLLICRQSSIFMILALSLFG
jgi:hypothetical protein